MRRYTTISIALLTAVIVATPAFADDFFPPAWRGQPGTTMQTWEFSTDANPAVLDVDMNPYGAATAEIEYDSPFTPWIDIDGNEPYQHQGVWYVEDWIEFGIPNNPMPNDYKEIWIQLTYYADGSGNPEFFTDPGMTGGVTQIFSEPVGPGDIYTHAVYSIMFDHNPDFETIWLVPQDCTIYVDEVVIDTICAPEPTTAVLMLLSATALLRRRR